MPEPWEPETGDESWTDRDAWRGETHSGDDEAWRSQADAVWEGAGEEDRETETETDDTLLEDWPENLAGPEYWLYKRYGM